MKRFALGTALFLAMTAPGIAEQLSVAAWNVETFTSLGLAPRSTVKGDD